MEQAGTPPLDGIKVVDLTRYLAGPFCTQTLGDYGAEIMKIEPVERASRKIGESHDRDGYTFLSANRSKRSVCLNFKHPEGRAVLLRLIERADVVVDNYRPGVMAAMGLNYEQLADRNPRIITCNISGFGSSGPLRDHPGFDQIIQGMSGLMSVTGTPESGPTRLGIAICDLLTGILAACGILLALEARHHTGRGQRVETSLLESIVSILTWSAGIYFETGRSPTPQGNHHPLSSPHGLFHASDRPLNIAVGNEAMWNKFVCLIERPELAADARFSTQKLRVESRAALAEEVNRALSNHPADYWIDIFNRNGIPAGPILTIEQMFQHPQIAARQMLLRLPHPKLGTFMTTGLPVKLGETAGRVARPAMLGEHTDGVLRESGFAPDEISRLREAGIIG